MRRYLLCAAVLVAACATNPVTGKSQLSLVSEADEIAMGQQQVEASRQETGFYTANGIESYVSSLGMAMAKASERPNLPWEFHVVDDPAVNAFAAPGGKIFVTRGIIGYMNSEAQLASVIGHEIGHVTAKHTVAQISQQTLLGGLFAVGSIVSPKVAQGIGGQLAGAAAQLYLLKYSRDDERQADMLGHRYSLHAKYDPREMPNTFRTLDRLAASSQSSKLPGFLSTHPDPGDRITYTQAWADTVRSFTGLKVNRDQLLTHIDGMLYGADPQQGYFESGRFFHPEMRFQFAVPQGWQGMNQASQVVLVEPNGAAQIGLTITNQSSAPAAAQAFFTQQGVQSAGVQNTTVNGLPATAGQFTAATQEGQQLHGLVYFIQYNGKVYQFMGLTLAASWNQFSGTLDQTLRSFGPTASNQQFKSRRWIRLVTLQRATSVTDLAAQSGGAATAAELAILNGVADGGTVAAGTRVKTVVYR